MQHLGRHLSTVMAWPRQKGIRRSESFPQVGLADTPGPVDCLLGCAGRNAPLFHHPTEGTTPASYRQASPARCCCLQIGLEQRTSTHADHDQMVRSRFRMPTRQIAPAVSGWLGRLQGTAWIRSQREDLVGAVGPADDLHLVHRHIRITGDGVDVGQQARGARHAGVDEQHHRGNG